MKKVIQIGLAVLALVGGIVTVWVQTVAGQQWALMAFRVEELKRLDEAQRYERPVLRGEAEPGNAWDDYSVAGAEARRFWPKYDIQSYIRGNYGYPKDPFSKSATAAVPLLGAWERLQRGTRRAEARAFVGYYHAMTPRIGGDDGLHILPWVGMVRGRALLNDGRPLDAVDVWLDLFQFGRDWIASTADQPLVTASDMLEYATMEVRAAVTEGKLPPEAVRPLDRGLEILERNWPADRRRLESHLLALGMGLMAEVEKGTLIYQGRRTRQERSWRWLYSSRLRAARTFNFCDIVVTRIFPTDPAAAQAVLAEWPEPVVDDSIWPLIRNSYGYGLPPRLRMLRIAVHFLATGEVLDLPSGTNRPIRSTLEGNALRVTLPDPVVPDDGSNDNWWSGGKPMVIRVVRNP